MIFGVVEEKLIDNYTKSIGSKYEDLEKKHSCNLVQVIHFWIYLRHKPLLIIDVMNIYGEYCQFYRLDSWKATPGTGWNEQKNIELVKIL